MKVLIIEDELQAAKRMESLVTELIPDARILATLDTVKRSVAWFKSNPTPDLVLMDIQLADGISFQIFDHHPISAPIIFTTAYDAYALKAFKVNSIDYILKPVDKAELQTALEKLKARSKTDTDTARMMMNIGEAVEMLTRKYKTRFVTKVGEHLKTIDVNSVLYFYSQDKATFCVTDDNRHLILDFTMEQVSDMLNPQDFFRVNRKYLIGSSAIQDIIHYTNSRLKVIVQGAQDQDIIVAREKVQEFRDWLDQ